jgi:NRPS condensation-like uncharacterized protein
MAPPIPSRLPARTEDIALHMMAVLTVMQIHGVLDFEGALDGPRLRRALRLLLDAEPVLGCRFVPRFAFPYWQRLEPAELDQATLLRELAAQADAERDAAGADFLAEPMPADAGPRISALWLRGDAGDRLVLKVHHQASDAGGVKELLYRLAEIYRALERDPGHAPTPRLGSRSLWQVYGPLLPGAILGLLRCMVRDLKDAMFPVAHLQLPMGTRMEGTPRFGLLQLPAARVAAIRRMAPTATVNDLVCAAVLRALVRVAAWNGRATLRIWGTVDLRRYLPDRRADGLSNLSGFMYQNLGTDLGEDYAATVGRVKTVTDRIKALWPGLGYPIGTMLNQGFVPTGLMRPLSALCRRPLLGWMPPVLTNMGAIDEDSLDFGEAQLSSAHLVVPASHPPGLIMGLSGYRGSVTISVGHFTSALPAEAVAGLLEAIDEELPGA